MSADHWLVMDTGGDEDAEIHGTQLNITYNLTPMLREAGYPGHREIIGQEAGSLVEMFGMLTSKLEDPSLDRLNPSNGWGDRLGAVGWARAFAEVCASHPKARVGGGL